MGHISAKFYELALMLLKYLRIKKIKMVNASAEARQMNADKIDESLYQ